MFTLYEIDNAIATCIAGGLVVDEETGEVLYDSANLEELEARRADKVEAVACFIKSREAEAKAIGAEIAALALRKKQAEAKAEKLREYLTRSMLNPAAEMRSFESARVKIRFRKSESVVVTDPSALPEDCRKTVTTVTPDKKAIKVLIKSGADVGGASLETRENIQIF